MKILVLGVAFTDIKGFPFGSYNPRGTNPGDVVIVHGGVARNVAEDLANLGCEVEFPLLLEENPIGVDVKTRLDEAGVSLKHSITVKENGIGMWLAVFNEKGDLAGSISKMPDVTPYETLLAEKGDELFADADAVVMEYDLNEAIAEAGCRLAAKYNKPLYAIVGNMSVILSRPDLMKQVRCAVMNEIEMGRLLGSDISSLTPECVLTAITNGCAKAGISGAVATLGERGCVYFDSITGESGVIPAESCEVVDTTGAGDSFFSAAVAALTSGKSLNEACLLGTRVAAKVVSCTQSVCPKMKLF